MLYQKNKMDSLTTEKNSALVTGAASGLGFEFAQLLARDNYRLILIDVDASKLKDRAEKIEKEFNTNVSTIVCDLALSGAAQKIYKQIKNDKIDILINNAGYGLSGFFKDTSWELEERMINLHILTPTHLTKLIVKDMIESGRGKIMNIASVAAFTPGPIMSVYYATKAYLLSFGNALSNELKGTGVSLTTVCPGLVRTSFSGTRANYSNIIAPKFGALADNSEKVSIIAYKAMLRGKALSVPVFKNRIMTFLTWLTPRPLTVRFVRNSLSKLHKK